ncbi:MAG: hotdog fold thioesterase [Actinomycetota bacterium]|nr:hotdog fold thioesterase [Actinomycetota bacterium]
MLTTGRDGVPDTPPAFYPPDDIAVGMQALTEALTGGAPTAEVLAAANRACGELNSRMGVQFVEFSAERMAATMPVVGNRQPFGLLHGGANAVLAETLGSFHANVLAPTGRTVVGIELNCTHHRASTDGSVRGVSVPLHVGRTMMTFEIVIAKEDGKRACTARLTCLVQPAPGHG